MAVQTAIRVDEEMHRRVERHRANLQRHAPKGVRYSLVEAYRNVIALGLDAADRSERRQERTAKDGNLDGLRR
jgi:adenosyl cobinamide kinase/adenosyl cobinamide phosphate guanylyltransferase